MQKYLHDTCTLSSLSNLSISIIYYRLWRPIGAFWAWKKVQKRTSIFAHSPPYHQKIAHLEGKICQYFGKPTKKVEWRLSGKQNFEWWKKGILSSKKVQNSNPRWKYLGADKMRGEVTDSQLDANNGSLPKVQWWKAYSAVGGRGIPVA